MNPRLVERKPLVIRDCLNCTSELIPPWEFPCYRCALYETQFMPKLKELKEAEASILSTNTNNNTNTNTNIPFVSEAKIKREEDY